MPIPAKVYYGSNLLTSSYQSSAVYNRPSDWLTLPAAAAEEVRALCAVFNTTENYNTVFGRTTDGSSWFVDWGDGTIDTVTSNTTVTHNYSFSNANLAGTTTSKGFKQAQVRVYAGAGKTFYAVLFNQKPSTPSGLATISTGWTDMNINLPSLAAGAGNLIWGGGTIRHGYLERINITSWGSLTVASSMFGNCPSLVSLNEQNWNMAAITNMSGMFFGANSIQQLDCSSWSTSSITTFANSFRAMQSLIRIKLTGWNTSACTAFGTMFMGCPALQDCDVSSFNTANGTDFAYMFNACSQLRTINVASWNMAKAVTINNMFESCSTVDAIDISAWSIPLCTNATSMFNGCANLQKLETCNFGSVTTALSNFALNCGQLKSVTLQGINQTVSFASGQMSSTALNTLYTNLATVTGKTITVTGNYGSAGSTTSIATGKGWTVVG